LEKLRVADGTKKRPHKNDYKRKSRNYSVKREHKGVLLSRGRFNGSGNGKAKGRNRISVRAQ
jgi:hypothetical protein